MVEKKLSLFVLSSHLKLKGERMDDMNLLSSQRLHSLDYEVDASIYIREMMLIGHPCVINTPEKLHRHR